MALQRYKALKLSVEDGSWDVAQVLEVLEHARSALATDGERMRRSRRQMQQVKLQNPIRRVTAGPWGGSPGSRARAVIGQTAGRARPDATSRSSLA